MRRLHRISALTAALVLGLLLQAPGSGAPQSHIVGGVNFDELDLGGGVHLHNGTYTKDDPHITTTLEGLYHGTVAGNVVAVAVFHDELPATGYDESITAYEVAGGKARSLGSLGEFSFFNDSGPYPKEWFYLKFSGGRLYADVWNSENRCTKRLDWTASTYTLRGEKWVLLNQLRHHRNGLALACETASTPSPSESAYNKAVAYEDGKHPATAAALWTKVLAMTPGDPEALDYRAHDYVALGQYGRAVADFTSEIKARSGAPSAATYNSRAAAYFHLGMYKSALADFTSAINVAQQKDLYYNNRGTLLFRMARYAEAANDFATVFRLKHYPEYAVLIHIARSRAGQNDAAEFASNAAAAMDHGTWPDPILQLYQGKLTPQDVIGAGEAAKDNCGAHFFVAEWQVLQGKPKDAHANLLLAQKSCAANTVGGYLTAAELARRP